jgi:hypothetical protein
MCSAAVVMGFPKLSSPLIVVIVSAADAYLIHEYAHRFVLSDDRNVECDLGRVGVARILSNKVTQYVIGLPCYPSTQRWLNWRLI